ncbi:MAG: DUF4286 family protein [Woeseia sp.]
MREHSGPIYEVTLRVATDAAEGLDDWLAAHVGEMLGLPGFEDAEISTIDDEPAWQTRVTRYYLASDGALDDYLAGPATVMRQSTTDRFGEHFEAARRVLRDHVHPAASAAPHCLNCDGILIGQYCGQCGQRADSRLISVWELVKDAFSDLLDVDSRAWRTALQLAFRPGQLTRDYLRGRRARYIPPFRTYLLLSLLFFLIALFDPREQFSLFFEPLDETAAPADEESASDANGSAVREEVLRELEAEGVIVPRADGDEKSRGVTVIVGDDQLDADCELEEYDPGDMPAWMGRRLSKERMQAACDRVFANGSAGFTGFIDKLVEYIPAGLFVLLPLMALFLKALYPLSKRYYVEHLLFVLHYHAFVFLALTSQVLLSRVGDLMGGFSWITAALVFAIVIYIPVYLYKALRKVYEQGHLLTTIKFVLIQAAYFVGLAVMFATMAIFAVFSV